MLLAGETAVTRRGGHALASSLPIAGTGVSHKFCIGGLFLEFPPKRNWCGWRYLAAAVAALGVPLPILVRDATKPALGCRGRLFAHDKSTLLRRSRWKQLVSTREVD